ncbi:SDR family oxidoreductase [Vibrio mexicanus]|uniref:SDR family oxidoreductase n=1 Tax=Vibrio mexicanus TaxID=1004326 RepID=UPI00063CBAE4|nr:SDR family oxidoreductase [Vibrio mexicanus]
METVLITGASRGIGLELTKQLLALDYKVIATYRNAPSNDQLSLKDHGDLTLVELEVTNESSIEALRESLEGQQIDVLINNAGIIGPDEQDRDNVSAPNWLETFSVNTIAPLLVSRAIIPLMQNAANPRIVTISSQMGALNRDAVGMYAYRSSKAAVNKVMQVMALELKEQGITVCPIHPGWVKTDMGGDEADITAQESAAGIIKLTQGLTLDQSGTFFTWEGDVHPW